ncbi:MAG TPA: phosphatidylserine synthase, partial [Pseudonocardia sp.]
GIAAALLITAPFLGLAIVAVLYLGLIPYSGYLHRWLTRHPEAWGVPVRERRAVARAARSARRLGLRPPLRRRVAGRASAVARAVRRFGDDPAAAMQRRTPNGRAPGPAQVPRNRLRLGLRRVRRR